mmetsp:Transcript_80781/g.261907  ORF Transcript_80781/g.261907 Transcript_80781/m.261907 type:complete len:191 (-) Transcript_80781:118-690(-)
MSSRSTPGSPRNFAQRSRIVSARPPRASFFSSDVSARGIDFPGVTAVIQVGAPSSKEQYIHRLGRTGRAGESGRGVVLLHDFEKYFITQLADLNLQKIEQGKEFAGLPATPLALKSPVQQELMSKAYAAWLGYYKGTLKSSKLTPEGMVQQANLFASSIGALDESGRPPAIPKQTIGKMGLKGVAGLVIG